MGIKTVGRIAAWGMAGAVLGALVWQRLALGFGALWLIPLGWGATSAPLEVGALMTGYYGAALSGSIVALTLFEGPWAGVPGWAARTTLRAAPWAQARAGHMGRRFPRALREGWEGLYQSACPGENAEKVRPMFGVSLKCALSACFIWWAIVGSNH